MNTTTDTQPEPTSLREALARLGITPTYWQPELPPRAEPSIPGMVVRFVELPE